MRVADRLSISVELVTVANMLFQFCALILCAPLSALPLDDRETVVSVSVSVCVLSSVGKSL